MRASNHTYMTCKTLAGLRCDSIVALGFPKNGVEIDTCLLPSTKSSGQLTSANIPNTQSTTGRHPTIHKNCEQIRAAVPFLL